jgi:hypothetical protein
VGEVATEDTGVEVDRLEAMGRGMAHLGVITAVHVEWGGALVRGLFSGCGGRLRVRGGAWSRWETHRHRGEPRWCLHDEVVDEVAVEEVAGGAGFEALRQLLSGRWLGVGAVISDPTWSCKVDSEATRLVAADKARWWTAQVVER